jgi:hypothetical protein
VIDHKIERQKLDIFRLIRPSSRVQSLLKAKKK